MIKSLFRFLRTNSTVSPSTVIDTAGTVDTDLVYGHGSKIFVKISGPSGREVEADWYDSDWDKAVEHAPSSQVWPDGSYTVLVRLIDQSGTELARDTHSFSIDSMSL